VLLVVAVVVLAALVSGYRLIAAARGDLAKAIVDGSARTGTALILPGSATWCSAVAGMP
jgi:uncharacterized membrane protein YjjP (DUF1212 family)